VSEPEELSAAEGRRPAGRLAHPALLAYQARTNRAMRLYAAVLAVLVLVAGLAVRAAYAHGELVHVSARSAAAPAPIPTGSTADTLELKWRSPDRPASGTPVDGGVVVTYDSHSVRGRDARTGKVRWFYTRSDESICSVLQQDATTIAIYNRHGNCDEVTGLVTATGAVKWLRTMSDNGQTQAASAPNVVLTVATYSVHVIDNAGGLDRWDWVAPDRCSVDRALAGSQGVLISTTCGSQHRLVLRALISDDLKWSITVPRAMVPIAASAFVGALDPSTGMLHSYSLDKGGDTVSGQLASPADLRAPLASLPRAATAEDGLAASGETLEVSWLGRLYSFVRTGTIAWTRPAAGPPTVVGPDVLAAIDEPAGGSAGAGSSGSAGSGSGSSAGAGAGSSAVVSRFAGTTGKPESLVTLSPAPAGSFRAFPVGTGLLLAAADTQMYQ
jgi:hypothetical protein